MLLFDLAIPRDIETEVGTLTDAYLYTIDDLERAVEETGAAYAKQPKPLRPSLNYK